MNEFQDETVETFTPWTAEGSARLLAAVSAVQEAISIHAQALVAAAGDDEAVYLASEDLMPALLAYADAQFNFTGYGFPLGVLAQLEEEDDDDEQYVAEEEQDPPATAISVVQRHDYVVTDIESVLANTDASHLGDALHELADSSGGWSNLRDVRGLEPVAGITAVIVQPELLGADPDDWAESVHDEHAEVLFSQAEVFGN